jgi:hypothetical protein
VKDAVARNRVASIVTPQEYGAKGDGVTDDTEALQNALNSADIVNIGKGTYKITTTLHVPFGKQLIGESAVIKIDSDFVANDIDGLPKGIVLFFDGRKPIFGDEVRGHAKKIGGFVLRNDAETVFEDGVIGVYMGYPAAVSNDDSKVNYSFTGYHVSDIYASNFNTCFYLAEAWDNVFTNLHTGGNIEYALRFCGQSVNNRFTDCGLYGNGQTGTAIYAGYNPNYSRNSEGCTFENCFIGYCGTGVNLDACLAFNFVNCIIDLLRVNAVHMTDARKCHFTNCWVANYTATEYCVFQKAISTIVNNSSVTFVGCTIFNGESSNTIYVRFNNAGINFSNCFIDGCVLVDAQAYVTVSNCVFNNDTPFTGNGSISGFGNRNRHSGKIINIPSRNKETTNTTDAYNLFASLFNGATPFYGTAWSGGDLNDDFNNTPNGVVFHSAGTANIPEPSMGFVLTFSADANTGMQLDFTASGNVYFRMKSGGNIRNWAHIGQPIEG